MLGLSKFLLASIFTLVELNCENLFDLRHDSLKTDTEWLIDGARRWNYRRYWDKINDIGKTVIACGNYRNQWSLPDVVALVEVENDSVVRDLCKRSLLRRAEYEYIVTSSADARGIDVALLYSPFSFQLLSWKGISVDIGAGHGPTRDILYAQGLRLDGDTLHVFVLHSPSRYGGEHATRQLRVAVVDRVAQAVDSIMAVNADAKVVITGDFNDYSDSPALTLLATHGVSEVAAKASVNAKNKATYRYQGLWASLDHFFISTALSHGVVECRVLDAPFLLEDDPVYGGKRPKRTYNGYRYNKGSSDHLPLILRLKMPV